MLPRMPQGGRSPYKDFCPPDFSFVCIQKYLNSNFRNGLQEKGCYSFPFWTTSGSYKKLSAGTFKSLKNSELSIRNRAALEARVQFLYRLSSFSSCFYRSYMVLLP